VGRNKHCRPEQVFAVPARVTSPADAGTAQALFRPTDNGSLKSYHQIPDVVSGVIRFLDAISDGSLCSNVKHRSISFVRLQVFV